MTKYDYKVIPNFCQNLRSTCNLADIDKHLDLDFTISDPPTLILPRPRPKLVSRGISATDYNYYCDRSMLEHIQRFSHGVFGPSCSSDSGCRGSIFMSHDTCVLCRWIMRK